MELVSALVGMNPDCEGFGTSRFGRMSLRKGQDRILNRTYLKIEIGVELS